MLALSIRQPYAELILRGIKAVELRRSSTKIIGERFYIYASKRKAVGGRPKGGIWSTDLSTGGTPVPRWMIELAEQVKMIGPGEIELLPRGAIVGTAVIERVEEMGPEDRGLRIEDGAGRASPSSMF